MGYYVNPPNESKESFLLREGLEVPKADWDKVPKNSVLVILISNGKWNAAGVAFSKEEYLVFTEPSDSDPRPRKIFIVEKLKLKEIGCDFPGRDE